MSYYYYLNHFINFYYKISQLKKYLNIVIESFKKPIEFSNNSLSTLNCNLNYFHKELELAGRVIDPANRARLIFLVLAHCFLIAASLYLKSDVVFAEVSEVESLSQIFHTLRMNEQYTNDSIYRQNVDILFHRMFDASQENKDEQQIPMKIEDIDAVFYTYLIIISVALIITLISLK